MAKILVPDYFGQQVLAGIRALDRQGDTCDLATSLGRVGRKFMSRHVRLVHPITLAGVDDEKYASEVISLCKTHAYDMILPFGNDAYFAVVRHAAELARHVQFMAPSEQAFATAHDKLKSAVLCKEIGLSTPQVYTDYADSDVRAIAKEIRYPVVIKARSGTGVAKGLRYANTPDELVRKYEEISSFCSSTAASNYREPLIQEFIPGHIHDACTLTDRGGVVAVLTQIRWLMYPIYGGVGAVNVTTHEPVLSSLARKLLGALEWNGPAQIEFKFDPRDGQYKFIEINPKLWGTLDLSIKAGINFPRMIRDTLMGKPVGRDWPYKAGIRYVFLFPQASLAYHQLARTFGLGALRRRPRCIRSCTDIDLADPLPDLNRAFHTLKTALVGQTVDVNANLDRALIPFGSEP